MNRRSSIGKPLHHIVNCYKARADRFLSKRSRSVDASGIRKVFDLGATLTDPINLSIGQPDFGVPEPVRQAAIEAIRAGHGGYTVTQGIAPLRERIAADLQAESGQSLRVLVTSGVSGRVIVSRSARRASTVTRPLGSDFSRTALKWQPLRVP